MIFISLCVENIYYGFLSSVPWNFINLFQNFVLNISLVNLEQRFHWDMKIQLSRLLQELDVLHLFKILLDEIIVSIFVMSDNRQYENCLCIECGEFRPALLPPSSHK